MSVGDPDDELLCGARAAGGGRRPYSREQRKRGNGSKVFHFSSHLILLMAGTVTRISCHGNFPCDKGVGAAGSNGTFRYYLEADPALPLRAAEAARWMATGKLHRKPVHFEVSARRSDKGEA